MAQQKDRWEIATFVVETIAAVGVIFSVIYLAIQVGGNTSIMRAQAHNQLLMQLNQPLLVALGDSELSEVIIRGMGDPDAISDVEWHRFSNHLFMFNNPWEYLYYGNEDGSTPPALWQGANAYYVDFAKIQPGSKRFWKELGHAYGEPFFSFADQYFSAEIPS